MIDDPHSLLGRLQRGRGDAVREMMSMTREAAEPTLVRCLCTAGELSQHTEAYVELVFALSPDLSAWFQWIDGLGPDATEEVRLYALNTLGELARRGHAEARDFLRAYVIGGCHWRDALSQFLVDGLDLDQAAWARVLPRIDDDELDLHIGAGLDSPVWRQLATDHERVRRVLQGRQDGRVQQRAESEWSDVNYASAASSQRRWRVLESLIRQAPEAAKQFLVDGLWDGSHCFRERCIAQCDVRWPGVRERLTELAKMLGCRSAFAARRRLEENPDP